MILEDHVILCGAIFKKGPGQASNYRPISLLNVNVKLYAKVLANHLVPLIPILISPHQVGFVPGHEVRDNTTKAINIQLWAQCFGV